MILYGITLELAAALKAVGVPYPVVYGPERTIPTTPAQVTRIVVERDRGGSDEIQGARANHTNPRLHGVTGLASRLRIYATSTRPHAAIQDHEGIADELRSKARVHLDKIIRGNETLWAPVSARFLTQAELDAEGLTTWPGVVYELKFTVDVGDFDTNFAGEAADEIEIGGPDGVVVKKNTVVRINGSDTEAPACGEP